MNSLAARFPRQFGSLQLSVLMLLTLLQRTPVLRLLVSADSLWLRTSLGHVLRSSTLVATALGVVDTLAGATTFSAIPGSPASATVGTPFSAAFAVTGAPAATGSYTISGLPPGLVVTGSSAQGDGRLLNNTSGTISGTPTTPGSFVVSISAWEFAGGTGRGEQYSYTINVTGAAATAPSITSHPSGQSVTAGQSASFSVSATGTDPLSYQWKKNGNDIGGATGSTYSIGSTNVGDGGTYSVVVSNSAGSATSNGATLTVSAVVVAPGITGQPASQSVTAGQGVTFTVGVSGTAPFSYQWRKNGNPIGGATGSSYTIGSTILGDAGTYSVFVSNSAGGATSADATLAVAEPVSAPGITAQPVSLTKVAGTTATFTVTATGLPAPTYQWKKDGVDLPGATSNTYTIVGVAAGDVGSYTVVVTNASGSVTSNPATLALESLQSALVRRLYVSVLGTGPTGPELATDLAALQGGGTLEQILTRLLATGTYLAREKERAIRLYYATFNRMPDQPGVAYWAQVLGTGAQGPTEVASAFAQSGEFLTTYGSLGNGAFVTQMYRNTLGRDPDQGGLDYWVGQMNAGLTRGQMLLAFADSQEFKDRMAAEIEVVRLYHVLFGRMPTGNELAARRGFLQGDDQTETILASGEFATAHPGGLDNAAYVQAAFQGFLLRAADAGTEAYFTGLFNSATLTRAGLINQIMDSGEYRTTVVPVTRHYLSVFLRAPDLVGSTFWTNQMRGGLSLTQLSQAFAGSGEFATSYAGLNDTQFVGQMYVNILGRVADTPGLNYWVNLFATDQSDEAGLLLSFVLSTEAGQRFAPAIRTIGLYQAFYGRNPTQNEINFWKDYLDSLPRLLREDLLATGEFTTVQ